MIILMIMAAGTAISLMDKEFVEKHIVKEIDPDDENF